jgi:bifunctional non-homologous end joining protein LigD
VGTGFDDALLTSLSRKFLSLKRSESPFEKAPRERSVTWLQPKLVAEVAYAERTKEGILRQAAFMGLREDIAAKSVGEEKAVAPPAPLKVTHPERLIWPALEFTKLDLVKYYEAVGEWFLPHVKDRPLSLVRCPDGAAAKCFFQRHPGTLRSIGRFDKEGTTYIYARSLEDALGAVQNGSIEFHTWGATVPDIRHPDRITMDLDPGPGITWERLVEGTRLVKVLLDQFGLKSFLKTTGGKGLHVVAPLQPKLPWDEVKEFTRLLAVMLTRARPDLFLSKMTKAARKGLIYVDYLRNGETASAVAAFSARARPEAGVSTTLSWDELGKKDLRPLFTVKTVPPRLKKLGEDPWASYGAARQEITRKMIDALKET